MKKIVVADDEESIRELVKSSLEDEDVILFEAENGRKALDCIKKERPQFIVADYQMPLLNGIELCREVRKLDFGDKITVIMLTSEGEIKVRGEARRAGVDYFITKPFSPLELLGIIEKGN